MKVDEAPEVLRIPLPPENAADAPFWRSLSGGELRLPKCGACGRWTWPAQPRCGDCGAWEFDWKAVAAEGVIYATARTRHRFGDSAGAALPYAVVLVEVPSAGGVRLPGLFLDAADSAAIGSAVRGVVRPATAAGERASLCWRGAQDL